MKIPTLATAALAAGLAALLSPAHSEAYVEGHSMFPIEAASVEKEVSADIDVTTTASITPAAPAGKAAKKNTTKSVSKRSAYDAIISKHATAHGVPLALAHAVVRVESNYRPNARGRAGEIGLMQIKPATARMMGYTGSTKGLYDPETNIRWGMKYLAGAHKLGGGDTCATILRYNAGHAAKRMNKVSASYCRKVKQHMAGA